MFEKFVKSVIDLATDAKAQITGTIITVVIAAIMIIVGVIIFEETSTSINRGGWSAAANTSFTNVSANTFSGFDLLAVAIIVLAAVAILGIVLLLQGRQG